MKILLGFIGGLVLGTAVIGGAEGWGDPADANFIQQGHIIMQQREIQRQLRQLQEQQNQALGHNPC